MTTNFDHPQHLDTLPNNERVQRMGTVSSEAENMARRAAWDRQQIVNDCKAVAKRVWAQTGASDNIETIMTRIIAGMYLLDANWGIEVDTQSRAERAPGVVRTPRRTRHRAR